MRSTLVPSIRRPSLLLRIRFPKNLYQCGRGIFRAHHDVDSVVEGEKLREIPVAAVPVTETPGAPTCQTTQPRSRQLVWRMFPCQKVQMSVGAFVESYPTHTSSSSVGTVKGTHEPWTSSRHSRW